MVQIIDTKRSTEDQYDEKTWELYREWRRKNFGIQGQLFDISYVNEIDKFLTSDSVLLDIGCGDGLFLLSEICKVRRPKFSKTTTRPKEIFAVDNSAYGIEAFRKDLAGFDAKDLPEMHLVKGDLARISEFGIPKCDLVISRYVFQYLHSIEEMKHSFEQVKGLLKPDGHFVFFCLAIESCEQPSVRAAFKELRRGNEIPIILPPDVKLTNRGFSVSEVIYACHAAGLAVKTANVFEGNKHIVQNKYHDGEPFPREKFRIFSLITSCVVEVVSEC